MLNRRVAVWAQSFAGAVLGIAAAATTVWSFGRGRFFGGFPDVWLAAAMIAAPSGCVLGLQLGSKCLLKHKGLNYPASFLAGGAVVAMEFMAGVLLALSGMLLSRANVSEPYAIAIFLAMTAAAAMCIARLAAAIFNAIAEDPQLKNEVLSVMPKDPADGRPSDDWLETKQENEQEQERDN